MTTNVQLEQDMAEAWTQLQAAVKHLAYLRKELPPEPVADYELQGPDGTVRLSQMFGGREDLILVHNMDSDCPYCTMWADGFNGVLHLLEDRTAFVVVSPDRVAVQQTMRKDRGWKFEMYSAEGTSFVSDLGFESSDTNFNSNSMPGVSAFRRNPDGSIVRISRDYFGPGDMYCVYCGVWHLFDLLANGADTFAWRNCAMPDRTLPGCGLVASSKISPLRPRSDIRTRGAGFQSARQRPSRGGPWPNSVSEPGTPGWDAPPRGTGNQASWALATSTRVANPASS